MGKILDALISITARPPQKFIPDGRPPVDDPNGGLEFVAMEYFGLILNRTFLIKATGKGMAGIKALGLVAVPPVVTEAMYDPAFYVPEKRRVSLRPTLESMCGTLNEGGTSFSYPWKEISEVTFNAKPKWGMGTVPYSGRIVLSLLDGGRRELILLGRQDGERLLSGLGARRHLQE